MGAIDFGLGADAALALPFLMQMGDKVLVEQGTWMEAAIARFTALGHVGVFAGAAPIKGNALVRRAGSWQSARDPRTESQLIVP